MWRPHQQGRLAKVGESSPRAAFPLQRLTNALEMRTPGVTQVFIFLTHKFKADSFNDKRIYLYSNDYLLLVVKIERLLHNRIYISIPFFLRQFTKFLFFFFTFYIIHQHLNVFLNFLKDFKF